LQHRILSEHFAKVKNKLLEYSKHFDIANHGDVKGYGREVLVSEFLESHLPDQIKFITGEIIDPKDNRSGQVDIILQLKDYPNIPLLGNVQLALIETVISVIEVKSTLNKQHLIATLNQFHKIKSLDQKTNLELKGQNTKKLNTIPCIIFAFKGLSEEKILEHINAFAKKNSLALDDFCPDMIVVLDSDFYICKNDGWQFPIIHQEGAYFRTWKGLPHENLVGVYNYLNNIIMSYKHEMPIVNFGAYFDKSVLQRRE